MKIKKIYKESYCRKQVIELDDGYIIENSYYYPYWICITTQVGCSVGCKFCKSGTFGLKRNLNSTEILEQINFALIDSIGYVDYSLMFALVSFSGMGEPLLNIENVTKVISFLQEKSKLEINISTTGIVNKFDYLVKLRKPITLDISMHAADSNKRMELIPATRNQTLERIIEYVLKDKEKFKKVTFDYLLLEEVNCDQEDLEKLITLFKGKNVSIELKKYNTIIENDIYKSPDIKVFEYFKSELIKNGIDTFIEESMGVGISAGCGQLVWKEHISK